MNGVDGGPEVRRILEHLFRRQHARIVSTLTRVIGYEHIDLVEDVVQETLIRALRHWPYAGIPANPAGWLYQVARNRAVDVLRRDSAFREKLPAISVELERRSGDESSGSSSDDQLDMVFACCHPALTSESQVALTLKVACGFGVPEIARAFLIPEATMAQRVVRAKKKLRDLRAELVVPSPAERRARLDSVLQVLYFLFNEGYSAFRGDNLVRFDLCEEAIRLALLLDSNDTTRAPEVSALLALMLFEAARLESREGADGSLVLLGAQDRTKWDQELIHRGLAHLDASRSAQRLSSYHLEAGVAACHVLAPSLGETDWDQILFYYDELVRLRPTSVVRLNRAVAIAMKGDPESALVELERLSPDPVMQRYYLFHSSLGELYCRTARRVPARAAYVAALSLAESLPERRFIENRLRDLGAAP